MHTAISDKKEELAAICQRYDVARLEVFGSAARGTDFDPATSDADFLVQFKPDGALDSFARYFRLQDALKEALNRPVDLVEPETIKNVYMKESIYKLTETVYDAPVQEDVADG